MTELSDYRRMVEKPMIEGYEAEITRLRNLLHLPLTSAELKLVDKHCDWIAFKHAWNAVIKQRLAGVDEQEARSE